MSRKAPPKTIPLEKIPESLSGEYDSQANEALDRKRVSIATYMNILPNGQKAGSQHHREAPAQENKVEEKDRMIKELQEEILDRKLKNDMIRLAFQRRNEPEQQLSSYANPLKVLVENCKILAAHSKPFKRTYLRSLVTICKTSAGQKSKAVKSLLIWTINWLTHLFTFLSSTLIKK